MACMSIDFQLKLNSSSCILVLYRKIFNFRLKSDNLTKFEYNEQVFPGKLNEI